MRRHSCCAAGMRKASPAHCLIRAALFPHTTHSPRAPPPPLQVLTGDMLLAASFVSYAGPFTSRFRSGLIEDWIKFLKERQTPMTEGITDPLKVCGGGGGGWGGAVGVLAYFCGVGWDGWGAVWAVGAKAWRCCTAWQDHD